ncbi:MAG: radical SAM protein [Chloroflexia bacterium]
MALRSVHLLLTYRCERECDHCFVWSSPSAEGVMGLEMVREVLAGALRMGTVRRIYLEGGEPFLYYPLMLEGMRLVALAGLENGIVTNAYWATGGEEARLWLRPLREWNLVDLTVSRDALHGEEAGPLLARQVAEELGIPVGEIAIAQPCGDRPAREGDLRFRGRAAEKLTVGLPLRPWETLRECPHEDLADPERVHLDPFGYVHLCQGLTLGNVRERPLDALFAAYRPREHPIVGPLLEGGPAALVEAYGLPHEEGYVEECHLCYRARQALRGAFPAFLGPGQMYGEKSAP